MYRTLPLSTPALVSPISRPTALAMPKAINFAIPVVLTRMFCGDTSRWTNPEQSAVRSAQLVGGVQAAASVGDYSQDDPRRDLDLRAPGSAREPRERVAVHP